MRNEIELKAKQEAYWTEFHKALASARGPVSGAGRKPMPQAWMGYRIGRGGFQLIAAMFRVGNTQSEKRNMVSIELYIGAKDASYFFETLFEQKQSIEKQFGYPLEWEEIPEKQVSRIAFYMKNANLEDKADWPRQHKWLSDTINHFHSVFRDRVLALPPGKT